MGSLRGLGSIVLVAATVAGCQPLYGDKAEHLHKPEIKHRPIEADLPPPEIKYIEECPNNFHDDAWKANDRRRDNSGAQKLALDGDNVMVNATKAKDAISGANIIKEAIDKYINALRKDPYDAPATLKLAIAYDQVFRKGCALALLKRLQAIGKYPDFRKSADAEAAKIDDNPTWFRGYRKEAIAAAGR